MANELIDSMPDPDLDAKVSRLCGWRFTRNVSSSARAAMDAVAAFPEHAFTLRRAKAESDAEGRLAPVQWTAQFDGAPEASAETAEVAICKAIIALVEKRPK